jgi:hypothetical protein
VKFAQEPPSDRQNWGTKGLWLSIIKAPTVVEKIPVFWFVIAVNSDTWGLSILTYKIQGGHLSLNTFIYLVHISFPGSSSSWAVAEVSIEI